MARQALLLTALTAASVEAMGGDIKGRIKEFGSQEGIIGATVQVMGTNNGVVTDMEGNFRLPNLPEGNYELEVKYVGYKTLLEKVRVESRRSSVSLDLQMKPDNQLLADVVVTGRANRESEQATLLEMRKEVFAVQSVGAKELSRKGVSDAQAAVAKVTGISRQEGAKNVFVRGLGDRYNSTTLNRFPIPSEDPEYKNISLDLFSTDIIQSVDVNKAFYGNTSADAGGAHINISSKELVGDGECSISLSGGLNSRTLSADVLKADGVNAFGFSHHAQPADGVFGFENSLDPSKVSAPLNYSYGFSGGKRFTLGGNPLSFFIVASHSQDYSYSEEAVKNTTTTGDIIQDVVGEKSNVKTGQLAMANINYALGKHSLDYNFLMVHASETSVGDYAGMNSEYSNSDDYTGFMRRQQTNDNLLLVNQLSSRWTLSRRVGLQAGLSYNTISGREPDRRINKFENTEEGLLPKKGTGAQQRYFSELDEKDLNLRALVTYKLNDRFDNTSNLQLGYTGRFVNDDFSATEYDMSVLKQTPFDASSPALDGFFNATGLADRAFLLDRNIDTYEVSRQIHSAYAEGTYRLTRDLTANVGLKYDWVDIQVDYDVNRGGTQGSSEIDKGFLLPSLNLKYTLGEKQALRLSASKTYTLPQAKEISPFRYVGVGFKSQGNPDLKPSNNYNVDLKWDFYLSEGELLSVTGFYKYIQDPIARIEINSAGQFLSYENIADHAIAAGVEVELRKDLFARTLNGGGESKLTFGVNGSYIYTQAKVDNATDPTGSQLEGAAPWIANADLSYRYKKGKAGWTSTVVFNYVSDRTYTIGTSGYQDIVENGVATLDFVTSAQWGKHLSCSLKAKNLLDPAHRLTRKSNGDGEKIVLNDYQKGVDVSLGVTYTF